MEKLPQIIVLCLMSVSLLLAAYLHGKPKKGEYSFWTNLISAIITFYLLHWGGFFNNLF